MRKILLIITVLALLIRTSVGLAENATAKAGQAGHGEVFYLNIDPAEAKQMLDEAVSLGILSEEMAARGEDPALETEIPGMLQAVFRHGYGKESAYLSKMADYAIEGQQASRYWFAMGIFYSYCEKYYDANVEDAWAFMDEMDAISPSGSFGQFDSSNAGVIHNNFANFNPDRDGQIGGGAVWDLCMDAEALLGIGQEDEQQWRHHYGNWWVPQVPFSIYDRVTGDQVLPMDEEQYWCPNAGMTVRDAAVAALHWWRYFEEPAKKVLYSDVESFDSAIITDELLAKGTDLPANSCSNLPADWHGQLMSKWMFVNNGALCFFPDRSMRQADMDLLKGAGLNFLKFHLSFSYLQAPDVTSGFLNETRLKELDKLLALCMENDIHLCLAAVQKQNVDEFAEFNLDTTSCPASPDEIAEFAAIWGALARRYAAIPNEYLSFNLQVEPGLGSDDDFVRVYGPSVEAIRAANPERTIISDIHCSNRDGTCPGAGMAGLGVALSYHLYDPRSFCVLNELPDREMQNDPGYLHSVKWPFTENGVTYTGETLLDTPLGNSAGPKAPTLNRVRAIAKQYGVGFMVNEFGIFGEYRGDLFARYRYTDETLFGFYDDLIDTFSKEGIGWCNGASNSIWAIGLVYPAVEGVEYKKIGYYYVDVKMQEYFRKKCEAQ